MPNGGNDKTYDITNFGGYSSNDVVQEIIIESLTNAEVSGYPGTFKITTYQLFEGEYYVVDEFESDTIIEIQPGDMSSTSVTTNSLVAYDDDARYTLQFTPQHVIPQNGKVRVVFPDQMDASDSDTC